MGDNELEFVARLVDDVTRVARHVRNEVKGLTGRTAPLDVPVQVDDRKALGAIGRVRSGLGGIGRVAAGAGKIVASGVLAGSLALGGLGAAGFAAGLRTAAGMESAKIAFTTMLGSGEKAGAFLHDLSDFAAKTPFEFPELQTAASSLISAGIEARKVIPIMTTLGNVTSGMGTGSEGVQRATIALQQMSAAGRITGEDLNQLRDAGIPVFDLLAAATGKSKAEVVKLAQAGKLGSKELGQLMSALESGKGLERFSGLMEKQSASLAGQWSTLKDTVNMTLAGMIAPAIPAIKAGMATVSKVVASGAPKVTAGLGHIVKEIGYLAAAAGDRDLDGVAEVLDNIFGNTGRLIPVFRALTGVVGATVGVVRQMVPVVADVVATALPAFGQLAAFVTGTLFPTLVHVLGLLQTQGLPIFHGLAAVVTGVLLPAVLSLAAGFVRDLLPIIDNVATLVRTVLLPIFVQVATFIGQKIVPVIRQVVHGFAEGLRPAIVSITAALQNHMPQIRQLVAFLLQVWSVGFRLLGPVIAWLAKTIFPILGKAIAVAINLIANIVSAVAGFAHGVQAAGRWIGQAFGSIQRFAGNMASFVIGDVIRPTVAAFLAMAEKLVGAAASAFGWVPGLGGKLKKAHAAIKAFKSDTDATLSAMAATADSYGEDIGKGVAGGVVKGIAGQTSKVAAESAKMAHAAHAAAARELQVASPSKVMTKIGEEVAAGLVAGMGKGAGGVRAAVAKLVAVLDTGLRQRRTTRPAHDAAVAALRVSTAALETLAVRRQRVASALARAETRLGDIRKARAEFAAQVRDAARGTADVTAIDAPEGQTLDAATLVAGLRDRLAAIRAFAANIAALRRRHLNATSLRQIIDAGVEGGAAAAAALAHAGGEQIAELNRTQAQVNAATSKLGKAAGAAMYAAGEAAAAGLVRGLRASRAALAAEAAALAHAVARAVKAALGIRSPSRVFADIGGQSAAGLAYGLRARTVLAERAAADMAARVQAAAVIDAPALAALAAGRARVALPPVLAMHRSEQTVTLRHEVMFRGAAPAGVSAADVADVLARDPQSAARIERVLTPPRRRDESRTLSASR